MIDMVWDIAAKMSLRSMQKYILAALPLVFIVKRWAPLDYSKLQELVEKILGIVFVREFVSLYPLFTRGLLTFAGLLFLASLLLGLCTPRSGIVNIRWQTRISNWTELYFCTALFRCMVLDRYGIWLGARHTGVL